MKNLLQFLSSHLLGQVSARLLVSGDCSRTEHQDQEEIDKSLKNALTEEETTISSSRLPSEREISQC